MSGPVLAYQDAAVRLYHCSHSELAAYLRETGETVDALIVDAPYSERTHAGHDEGGPSLDRMLSFAASSGGLAKDRRYAISKALRGDTHRRALDYGHWCASDIDVFVDAWSAVVSGWMVSLTDDVLFPSWRAAMKRADRTVFADVPALITGMTVRLAGDGPSSWTIHCAMSRPRSSDDGRFPHWGTLPGGYALPYERGPLVGGKPLSLMRALIRDYSRPGDLVCDPCCGAGTTLLAAKLEGRRAIGCDIDAAHVAIAAERLRDLPAADRHGTLALFGEKGSAA